MIIIKPDWISHADRTQDNRNKKPCIYSLHVSPDGKRLATGSLDGNVKIWNTSPIFDESAEKDDSVHKLLCTMTMHNGAVLCVRWSNGEGRYLASSSDNDNVIIIWERDINATAGSVFGSIDINHETWRATKYLRGHESDVQDLAWSKDNQYLASCSVDGFVIVWDGTTFGQVKKIDQHGGFVKGVTWDPAGKFLASQSDDKMVKVWRTTDWALETDITSPFINAPGTTLFRRLSWAPDGSHVAAANAVNGIQCIAAIINRDDWNANVSLVGHQLPVEVTSFNPKMFYIKGSVEDEDEDMDGEEELATICALGSQDRSISIWVTKLSRPLCVAADIFDSNVYDLCWTPDGRNLFACSQDGTVACIQLNQELENVANDDVIYKELSKYGYGRKNTQLPETAIQLELEAQAKKIKSIQQPAPVAPPPPVAVAVVETEPPVITSSSTKQSNIISLEQQKVSIAKNGKKRIQPIMLSSSSSSTTVPTTTTTNTRLLPNNIQRPMANGITREPTIIYDEPMAEINSHISSGNKKRRQSLDTEENEISNGNKSSKRPEWIQSIVPPPSVIQKSQVKLGLPKLKSILTFKPEPDTIIECHNNENRVKIVCIKKGVPIWMDYMASAAILVTGNHLFSCVASEDGSLILYSPKGKRLFPPIILESTAVILTCQSQYLLCLTCTGLLSTWNILHFISILHNLSIAPILQIATFDSEKSHKAPSIKDVKLQSNGLPILVTSLQQAFLYHTDMRAWLRISDAWYILSEFWGVSSSTDNPLGWLSTKLTAMDPTTKLISDLANTDPATTAVITISHIETQLAVAALLQDDNEYRDWLIYYATKLVQENQKDKVEELCKYLLGPPYMPSELTEWDPTIMGTTLSKRGLLARILPVLAQNRELQRIVTEFKSYLGE